MSFLKRGLASVGRLFNSDSLYSDAETHEIKKKNDYYENQLLKQLATPAPTVDLISTGQEADVRLPRLPFNETMFYLMRWQSIVLRTVCLKVKQEIFRETLKEGFDWEGAFKLKCNSCGVEYESEVEKCDFCHSEDLKKPDPTQKKLFEPFEKKSNKAEQTFLDINQEIEDDVNTCDDQYLVVLKDYMFLNVELFGKVKGLMRGDPARFRIVANESGERGGKYWICVKHRDYVASEPGYCEDISEGKMCGLITQDVHYVETEGGTEPVKYYIEGEVIHNSKYEPSRLYGISPIFTLWVLARTLQLMDNYAANLYEKGRVKGVLGVATDNTTYLEKWWDNIQDRLRKDPHYLPVVAIESGDKGKGRLDFVRLMDTLNEMGYTAAKEMMNKQIAALYGIMPIIIADTSTGGGLNNEGLQITVTDRAVDWGQSLYHNKVYPQLFDMLGITDWKLKLKPSREADEMAELQRMDLRISSADRMLNMGFDVDMKDEEFVFSGQAKKEQAGGLGGFSGFSQYGQTNETNPNRTTMPDNTQGEKQCPPGQISTTDNPKCHPIEWDQNKSIELNLAGIPRTELEKGLPIGIIRKICQFLPFAKADQEVNPECLAGQLSKLTAQHSDWSKEKIFAVAVDKCQVSKSIENSSQVSPDHVKESGQKIEAEQEKIEHHFTNQLMRQYNKELSKLEDLTDKSPKAINRQIDSIVNAMKPKIEKLAFAEVLRAYKKGKGLVKDIAKMSPIMPTQMGKVRSARRTVTIIPEHTIYNEPFLGGANIFLKKENAQENHLNDYDTDIMTFYKMVQSGSEDVYNQLVNQKWKADKAHFFKLRDMPEETLKASSDLDRAYRKLYLRRYSFGGTERSFSPRTLEREAYSKPPRWLASYEKFKQYSDKFKGANLTAGDWLEPTKKADSPKTFHFFDPPYDKPDVIRHWCGIMCKELPLLKGKWMFTFADDKETKSFFKSKGFNVNEVKYMNQMQQGKSSRTELIITNYPVNIPKGSLFKRAEMPTDEFTKPFDFTKKDWHVLRAIYKRNPFWQAFANMSQSISDKLKEHITESYESPHTGRFKATVRDVLREHERKGKPITRKHAEFIAYGRIGKFSLSRVMEQMKRTVNKEAYQLERIARSETTAVTAKGREIAFEEQDHAGVFKYDWFGPIDHRTSDECKEIERRVEHVGKGEGVPLEVLKEIMADVVAEMNAGRKSKWGPRDWLPHANCRRVLRRVN